MFFYFYKIAVRASLEVSDVAGELAQPKKLKKLQVLWYLSHANVLVWQQVFHRALFFSLSMTLDSFLMSSLNNFQNYLAGWEILSDTQSSHMPAVDPSVLLGTGYPTWTGWDGNCSPQFGRTVRPMSNSTEIGLACHVSPVSPTSICLLQWNG